MHVPETQIEKLRFARRHLHLLAGVGIAAVLTRTKPARACLGRPFDGCVEPPAGQCFLKGTKIITKAGERPIEELAPGDLVLTRNKGFQPVEDIIRLEMAGPPVRVACSALADGCQMRMCMSRKATPSWSMARSSPPQA